MSGSLLVGLGLAVLLAHRVSAALAERRIRAHEAALERRLGQRLSSALKRAATLEPSDGATSEVDADRKMI